MTTAVRERRPLPRRARDLPLREAELSRLWAGQLLPPEALITTDGRRVFVRYRGRTGNGPGPDFRDAVIWLEPAAERPDGAPACAAADGVTEAADKIVRDASDVAGALVGADNSTAATCAGCDCERSDGRVARHSWDSAGESDGVGGSASDCASPPDGTADRVAPSAGVCVGAESRSDAEFASSASTDADVSADARQTAPAAEATEASLAGWLRGDVELHVRASDFARHGHALDRAYLRVALHVVFEDDAPPVRLLDGRVVPTVALGAWVTRRAGAIRLGLGGDATYREPCHDAVARLGAAAVGELLRADGAERLRLRAVAAATEIAAVGAEEALYRAVARALGLRANVAPMEAVARALPLADLRAVIATSAAPLERLEALLLGAAGLLDGQLALLPDGSTAQQQRALWQALGAPRAVGATWDAAPHRPGTGPRERLRALAALLARPGPPFDATRDQWRDLLQAGARALLATLTVERLAGRDRALEIAVNALLPWLAAQWSDDAEIAALVPASYSALPAPAPYGATRLLHTVLRDDHDRTLLRDAAAVQGALELTRCWCTRGGCGRCPLS